jgi:hypothetical protein
MGEFFNIDKIRVYKKSFKIYYSGDKGKISCLELKSKDKVWRVNRI